MGELMQSFRIRRVVSHSHANFSLYFDPVFHVDPGQFVHIWLPGVDEKPFSVSDLTEKNMEITVRAVGPFTRALQLCKEGDRVGLRGPFGNRFHPAPDALLVGGGIGLAPIRFLARRCRAQGIPFRLLAGVRTASDLIFPEEYSADGATIVASDDGSIGRKGIVTDFLPDLVKMGRISCIHSSGPEPMLLALRERALALGIPVQLSFERYMKCGIGICGQCCLDGSGIRLCVEGPVLSETQIAGVTEWGLPHRSASGRRPSHGS